MKQLIQHLRSGETILEDVPMPDVQPGHVLIQTVATLVSAGTERMIVEFSKAGLLSKARQQPQRVRQVIDKIKTDGLFPTIESVFQRLDEPLPLGYCNAGIVVKTGTGVKDLKVGDRVASNGAHAEFVAVPKNLVVKIPDNVSFEEAAFTPAGAIALQGIRLITPQLGDKVFVIGLGLIGMLTAQLLRASGCNVIASDLSAKRVSLARQLGIDAYTAGDSTINEKALHNSRQGFDAILITASSKEKNLINDAAGLCRKKGKIVLIGVAGIEIERDVFYKKELSFQVSCSYGPGRYDAHYEEDGLDYPSAYVPYTAQRNFESFLEIMSSGNLDVQSLITQRESIVSFASVYGTLGTGEHIASILLYNQQPAMQQSIQVSEIQSATDHPVIGIIGAGNFSRIRLLPVLRKLKATVKSISSANGLHAKLLAEKYHISNATSDTGSIINDPDIQLIIIATRHHLHADLIIQSLEAGKHVFVEKPLSIDESDLEKIIDCRERHPSQYLFVGFNRRYSPYAAKAKSLIGGATNMQILMTVNAGSLPPDHWLLNSNVGGGRLIGEGCHFFDLASYFCNSSISSVYASEYGSGADKSWTAHLQFRNGASALINYLTVGNRRYPKETIEIFAEGRVVVIDNFRSVRSYGSSRIPSIFTKQDKGHYEEMKAVLACIENGFEALIPLESLINTTNATFAAMRSIREQRVIEILT